jgi:mRNA interferase MazF
VTHRAVPDGGDLIWLTFDPQAGHEHRGRRPGLVLSPKLYNQKSGLALVCPVTNQIKGYPFEVALPAASGVSGVILADQVKSVDWRARKAERIGTAPAEVMQYVLAKLAPLLGF